MGSELRSRVRTDHERWLLEEYECNITTADDPQVPSYRRSVCREAAHEGLMRFFDACRTREAQDPAVQRERRISNAALQVERELDFGFGDGFIWIETKPKYIRVSIDEWEAATALAFCRLGLGRPSDYYYMEDRLMYRSRRTCELAQHEDPTQ